MKVLALKTPQIYSRLIFSGFLSPKMCDLDYSGLRLSLEKFVTFLYCRGTAVSFTKTGDQ